MPTFLVTGSNSGIGLEYCRQLQARGIAVALLHPGLVRTRMVNFNPQGISPEEAVRGLLARIDALSLATSGGFWHANGTLLPW
jgi:NAD(P)-dependent dehydrogenase (short-subunit alcohol dehydrogenase family)